MVFTINSKKYGKFDVLIDDEDWEDIKKYNWFVTKQTTCDTFYVSRNSGIKPNRKTIRLSRHIMNANSNNIIDHISRDTMDNRKANLRVCSRQQNNMNATKRKDNKTGYKGVQVINKTVKNKIYTYIRATIRYNNKVTNIGSFKTAIEAARAYDIKAKELFGEFACLNGV